MLQNFLTKVFGKKEDRDAKQFVPQVDEINRLETKINQFNMALSRFKHNEVEKFIKDDSVSLILGDNIFFGHGLVEMLSNSIKIGLATGRFSRFTFE